jgi:hypothetical protein
MSVSKLKEILDEIDYPVLTEIVDCVWCHGEGENDFFWNTEDSLADLEYCDGDTYSTEAFEGEVEYDGYLVVNGNNGCGQTITYFFNLSKEVKF